MIGSSLLGWRQPDRKQFAENDQHLGAAELVMAGGRQAADDARCVGVLEQPFRCCRGRDGCVLASGARFLALPLTENNCLKRSNPPQTYFHGYFRKNLVT